MCSGAKTGYKMTNELLYHIQKEFPMSPKPFREIAKRFDMREDEVISILQEEKAKGIIRQISAIFDTKKLGYKSSLVAFKIDKNDIDKAARILNAHPGISHNYERDHDFNIWFTIAVDPDSRLGLDKTVEILAKLTKAKEYIKLPTLKLFKIAVKLDTTGKNEKKEKVVKSKDIDIKLTPLHKKVIELAQNDIEIKSEPFREIVEKLDIGYDTFFNILKELKDSGMMRRYAAILNHRKAGFNANTMVVWGVDEDIAESEGKKAAAFSAVSHCYLRPKYPNWPYNLFTMIHGKTKDDTNGVINSIAKEIQHNSYRPLYSTREFKKVRVKYFTDESKKWEKQYI